MSRVKVRQLRGALKAKTNIVSIWTKENKRLRKRIAELEEICENHVKEKSDLHKEIDELKKDKNLSIREKLVKKFFS